MSAGDRYVNNKPLRSIVACCAVLLLAAAVICGLISYYAAKHIVLLYAGNDPLYVVYTDRFYNIWLTGFALSFGVTALFILIMCFWSYRNADRILHDLALLANEAERLSHLPEEVLVTQRGCETGELRRLCGSMERLARRTHSAYTELKKQKRLHADLLVNLSHQLKTSLAVISLNRDMLASLPLPDDERQRLSDEIALHLDGMEELILNVLKLSRLSADAVQYRLAETDIVTTCGLAAERVAPLCREKNIAVKLETVGKPQMMHDRVWFCEAVENLLKNAVDHAECTEVRMVLTELPGAVKIQIIDNGCGIPLSEIPHLFDRFRRCEKKSPMNTGVGMAISKEIFSAHGGAITVYSDQNGTQFLSIFMHNN